jgi:hypothetical protein
MAERCTLCGEPMMPGEEMFKFHGSLGPCPKPPLPRANPETTARNAFANRIRSLHCIDKHVVDAALREAGEQPLTEENWIAFRTDPARFFINTDGPTSSAIWRAVEARQRDA